VGEKNLTQEKIFEKNVGIGVISAFQYAIFIRFFCFEVIDGLIYSSYYDI